MADANYTVQYYRRSAPISTPQQLNNVRFSKRIDDVGTAEISHAVNSVACCEQFGVLEPFLDSVAILRDGQIVWYGWIIETDGSRSGVFVEAFEALGWLRYRPIQTDIVAVAEPITDVFADIWDQAITSFADPDITLVTYPCTQTVDRTYLGADLPNAYDISQELFETGIDVVSVGSEVHAGCIPFGTLYLNDTDFDGELSSIKEGETFANNWLVKGDAGIVGSCSAPDSPYPPVFRVVEESEILDVSSANANAESRCAYSEVVPRRVVTPAGSRLLLCDNLDLKDLLPGKNVILNANAICGGQTEQHRLTEVEVNVTAGNESVAVTLSPTGIEQQPIGD